MKPKTKILEAKNINDALEHVQNSFKYVTRYGLWFRGMSNFSYGLIPSIFRQGKSFDNIGYNEMGMFREFVSLRESQRMKKLRIFEWLILMQHYNLPTRLLDWSSNLLVALFFAIENKDVDGALYILEPTSLNAKNEKSGDAVMYDFATDEVIIRANLSLINDLENYINLPEIKNMILWYNKKLTIVKQRSTGFYELDDNQWQKSIQTPIAVSPPQQNDRMFLQHGKFTLHGGKFKEGIQTINSISIEKIAKKSLVKIKIPATAKKNIEQELEYCGINEANLFPELEYQSNHIKENWTFKM